jgi:hypothetical protein
MKVARDTGIEEALYPGTHWLGQVEPASLERKPETFQGGAPTRGKTWALFATVSKSEGDQQATARVLAG